MLSSNRALSCDAEGRMQRLTANPWIWADPAQPIEPYGVIEWKGGALYAGPEESLRQMPQSLIKAGSLRVCDRAEALRIAVAGEIRVGA